MHPAGDQTAQECCPLSRLAQRRRAPLNREASQQSHTIGDVVGRQRNDDRLPSKMIVFKQTTLDLGSQLMQ